ERSTFDLEAERLQNLRHLGRVARRGAVLLPELRGRERREGEIVGGGKFRPAQRQRQFERLGRVGVADPLSTLAELATLAAAAPHGALLSIAPGLAANLTCPLIRFSGCHPSPPPLACWLI